MSDFAPEAIESRGFTKGSSTAHRGRTRKVYEAALRVAPQGQAVRFRFESARDAENACTGFSRYARLMGTPGHVERGGNHTVLFWVDVPPGGVVKP